MMTSDRHCFVFVALPDRSEYVVAGRFRGSVTLGGDPLGEFVYGRSYLSRPDAVELDPVQLRLSERVRRTRSLGGLFGAMRDSMLATWGFLGAGRPGGNLLREEQPGRGSYGRGGAIAFARGLEPPRPDRRFCSVDDLVRLQTVAADALGRAEARSEKETPPAIRSRVNRSPKATVARGRTLWIAKFAQDHTVWNHARIRHATLQLGRRCGLDTITSRIERVHGNDILMVRRYDREWVDGGYACSRLISGLTLLGTDDTPAQRRRWSYLTLADEVRRSSSHPREDLGELFRRLCYNAAISNAEDHPGQPMMVAKGHGWRVAPASGLAPTPVTDDAPGGLAMVCGPEGRVPSRENIVGGAGRFLLSRLEAEAIFDRIATTVRSSWHEVMRLCGVSARDCELVARSIARGAGSDSSGADRTA